MITQIVAAVIGTISFSVLFSVSRKQRIFCGLTGGVGWFVYLVTMEFSGSYLLSTLLSAITLTTISRALSTIRKAPTTLFLISGIFTLVPGAGIYYTSYYLFMNDSAQAFDSLDTTVKIALAIAFGIALGYTLPPSLFGWGKETVEERCCHPELNDDTKKEHPNGAQ